LSNNTESKGDNFTPRTFELSQVKSNEYIVTQNFAITDFNIAYVKIPKTLKSLELEVISTNCFSLRGFMSRHSTVTLNKTLNDKFSYLMKMNTQDHQLTSHRMNLNISQTGQNYSFDNDIEQLMNTSETQMDSYLYFVCPFWPNNQDRELKITLTGQTTMMGNMGTFEFIFILKNRYF
jgi:hypothetical protein